MKFGMPIMVVLMAVGIINPSGVDASIKKPWIIKLLQQFSPISLAVESLLVAEYKGAKFDEDGKRWKLRDLPRMGALALVKDGDQVLDALSLGDKTYYGVMKNLAKVSAFNLLASWVGLAFFGPKFVQATGDSPEDEDTAEDPSAVPIQGGAQNKRSTSSDPIKGHQMNGLSSLETPINVSLTRGI
mmetsp:Transcript_11550/g.16838  ORF Transcript_11550/g.16838 Transcript_11550/m.16838 type:complete len:186 (-) Transcript_11550:44-601(-)